MSCDTSRLSDYLDDELTPRERREADEHLAGCAECRELLAELAIVKETATDLAGVEHMPEADLWPGVAWRMKSRRGISLSWMQALAAGLALVALSSGAVWMAMRGGGTEPARTATAETVDRGPEAGTATGPVAVADFGEAAYENAVNDLRKSLEAGRSRLDPQTIQVIERNLTSIDQAIEQARKALEADPANVSLNSYLAGVRRRKLDLLRTASDLTQPAS